MGSVKMDLDEETPLLIRAAPNDDDPGDQVPESRGSMKRKFYGVATAVGSSIAFATYNTYVKRFEQEMVDVLILRSMFEFFVFGGLAIYNGHRFWPDKSECESLFAYKLKCFLLFFQGFCAGIIMILCFAAVTAIPIGDALTVVYSNPIFTMIFSAIFLGNRLRLYKITLGLVLSLGIVLVVKPPFLFPDIVNHTFNNSSNINSTAEQYILNHNVIYKVNHTVDYQNHTDHGIHYFIGVGLALMAAIGSAAMGVCINFLKEFKLNVLLCYSGGACALQLLAIVAFDKKSKLFYDPVDANLNQIVLLAGISIVAMLLNTLCYQLLDPSVASIFRTLELVFAFILQSYFTNSLPNSITLYGTSLVIFSAIVIPLENIVLSRLPYS